MQDKYNFIAINYNLKDICKSNILFEDISLIISDNFVQTIFVVLKDSYIN